MRAVVGTVESKLADSTFWCFGHIVSRVYMQYDLDFLYIV